MTTQLEPGSRVTAMAKVEALRYARHPVFLVGAVLAVVVTVASVNHPTDDVYTPPTNTAFFLGVFGMVVGFRLARSSERSAEAIASAPLSAQERVGALQLACLLPAALGLLSGIALLVLPDVKGSWVYGTWPAHQRVAIVLGQTAVASLGGPLLGIAAARWLRFPGAVVVAPVVVVTWVVVLNARSAWDPSSTGWLAARLLSPFALFHALDTDPGKPHAVESWRGNPWFFLLWLVLLCAAAALLALLKDSEPATRDRLRRLLLVVVVAALAGYALAVATGPDHVTVRDVNGVRTL